MSSSIDAMMKAFDAQINTVTGTDKGHKTRFDGVKDSGKREEFSTGSVRDIQEGKGRFDLIPFHGLERVAIHFENGAKKYGDRNWEKGQPMHCYLNSAIRHLFKYLAGWRDEDHLAAAAWNCLCAIHTEEMIQTGKLPAHLADIGSNDSTNGTE